MRGFCSCDNSRSAAIAAAPGVHLTQIDRISNNKGNNSSSSSTRSNYSSNSNGGSSSSSSSSSSNSNGISSSKVVEVAVAVQIADVVLLFAARK